MASTTRPQRLIETKRVILRPPHMQMATDFAVFFKTQWGHLEPWSPHVEPEFFTEQGQATRLKDSIEAFDRGTAWKWVMYDATSPDQMIGYIHYFQIIRGCFHNAMLGYAIGKDWEGKGLMSESLRATQAEVFGSAQLHRVQANVIPDNVRSLALLERLGFRREGLAKDYLCINGVWRDHVLTACLNPSFS